MALQNVLHSTAHATHALFLPVHLRRAFRHLHNEFAPLQYGSKSTSMCSRYRQQPTRALFQPIHASSIVTEAAPAQSDTQPSSTEPAPAGDNVVSMLRKRGLIADVTSTELEKVVSQRKVAVYCGFDPTAESLHLGNLLGIIVLSWFQRYGHRPVALLGGATGRVGDPSGKSVERPVLSEEVIERNVAGIERILQSLLARSNSDAAAQHEPLIVNNLSWFGQMGFLQFLREVGKYARMGTMLSKDSVRTRLESDSGLSFTEFTYQLLQGYDFVHLRRTYGVEVQIGGSDQWGNIVSGTELFRKMEGTPEGVAEDADPPADASTSAESSCYGLTFPLLTSADGKKFGKSEGGAIWLAAEYLSPYKFYQYLFKTTDADVVKFLKMLTFLPLEEIAAMEASMSDSSYLPNTLQRRLAEEVTRFVHGEEGVQQALRATEALAPGSDTKLDAASLEAIAEDAPTADLSRDKVVGVPLVDLVVYVGLQPSKGATKRLIKGGGLRMNNAKVQDDTMMLSAEDLIDGRLLLLATGKKNKMLVRVAA